MIKPLDESSPNKNIAAFIARGMTNNSSTNSLIPAKLLSANTGEPANVKEDVTNFDSAGG